MEDNGGEGHGVLDLVEKQDAELGRTWPHSERQLCIMGTTADLVEVLITSVSHVISYLFSQSQL